MSISACTLSGRYVVGVPIDEAPISAAFAFAGFAFFFALVFSFSSFALLNVVCIAASWFGVCREVSVLADEVVDERAEVSSKDVVVVHLPSSNDRIELWPAFDGFLEGLGFSDVGHLLIETAKGLIVIAVVCHMVDEVFEVRERALEIGFYCRDVLSTV